ncbi:MAG: Exodeoxyribonuclease III [Candidatus Magnetoglobus multicellularis str. Araruama]|uniref:Exodeoxyribonuclease III n=1 Tax=Candidatus Magnetoglobus multicellularis str. Araruama TaxID=890399 RepID=A0A1V1PBH5_9BACT|nr:MAG: Exodeoxyribonuclease III [Candidatus Magnetoglobus multicellularis str. Araruama]
MKKTNYNNNLMILSWNVNGIRSAYRKGFLDWLVETSPDILCLQEVRATTSQLSKDLVKPKGYYTYWNSAIKKGYAGTALFSREKPLSIKFGLDDERFDQEGRTIIAEYNKFTLINCYTINGNRNHSRLLLKFEYYDAILAKCEELRSQGHAVIFGGDINVAHKEIDLANPKSNKKNSGFLPEEREWVDKVLEAGYFDTFRYFYPDLTKQYSWWSYTHNARKRNVGWRFDYIFADKKAIELITDAFIMREAAHSDHSPVGIYLKKSD